MSRIVKRRTPSKGGYLRLLPGVLFSSGFVALAALSFDRLLLTEGVPRFRVLLLSNLLTGIVAGGLFLVIRIRAMEKQRLLEQRLDKIAEMNHHIRNALQVVSAYTQLAGESKAVEHLTESIRRIEWAVREVLPKGWDLEQHMPVGLREVGPSSPDEKSDPSSPDEKSDPWMR